MKYIFWDFNGTILDDAFLCYEILNKMLKEVNRPTVTFEKYLMIFDFPVKDYYAKVYDLNETSFDVLAKRFIELYQPLSLNAPLHKNVVEVIKYFKEKGYKNIILSASEINNLKAQLKHFKIDDLFDEILGTSNVYAKGKIDIAKTYIKENKINIEDSVMIGDTLHDAKIAKILGAKPILFTKGHQHPSRLKMYNSIDDFNLLKKLLD
ncbi:MAG: HAD-IA family hydrolase [Acholeplasmataceae bacterium]